MFSKTVIIWSSVGIGAVVVVSLATTALMRKRKRAKIKRVIDTVQELGKASVRMKDPDHVEELVCRLIKGGAKKLQVITDFDNTITRSHLNGKRCCSTHCVVEDASIVPKEFRLEAKKIQETFYPIEIDPHMSMEDKIPYMVEWYNKSHNILVKSRINKADIPKMIEESTLMLRDGCEAFFEMLHDHEVPTLVFSAGLGDVLEGALLRSQCMYPNLKFLSNYMEFDDQGNVVGFKGEVIHMFNKNRSHLRNQQHFDRSSVLLLGDSLGDLDMLAGEENHEAALRIGFLNAKIEERLPQYMNSFDIVLVDDQTMDVVNGILRKILY
ncbi:cytosolic 5'-nucleotidase 3-like [Ornithodoros turicata]|uniref:5'-nucleotidase n=1 Tax=Ornithodoros turicata TaxID=34597 RepID=A0A2R5LJQ6_9ACAR